MFYYGILIQDLFKRNFFENNLISRLKSISGFFYGTLIGTRYVESYQPTNFKK